METMYKDKRYDMAPERPWGFDYYGLPVLDSVELIVQYAEAVLHRPVAIHEVHWEPCDVDSVQLYVGCRWEDSFAEAVSHMNGDMEALNRMREVMRRKPVMLGRVNGVAADVLLRLPDMV